MILRLTACKSSTQKVLADQRDPHCDPAAPVLMLGLTNVGQVTKIATALLRAYPSSHSCALLDDADRHELSLGDLAAETDVAGGVCRGLHRSPDQAGTLRCRTWSPGCALPDGCPWDRELTWVNARLGAGGSSRTA